MYADINRYVKDAFLFDFNMLVEQSNQYQQLPPKMQTEIINSLETFATFQSNFDHFFAPCETGFKNEIIIQMFTRIYEPDTKIVDFGKKFR